MVQVEKSSVLQQSLNQKSMSIRITAGSHSNAVAK